MSTKATEFRRQLGNLRVEIYHEVHDNLYRLDMWSITCNSDTSLIIPEHMVPDLIEMFKGEGRDDFFKDPLYPRFPPED